MSDGVQVSGLCAYSEVMASFEHFWRYPARQEDGRMTFSKSSQTQILIGLPLSRA